jgi:hypothetical protein
MDEMEWALFGLGYLRSARRSVHEELNHIMDEFREHGARHALWFSATKNVFQCLYHVTDEFPADGKIPGGRFGSPAGFAQELVYHQSFLDGMLADLNAADQAYQKKEKTDEPPSLINMVRVKVHYFLDAAKYVKGKEPTAAPTTSDGELSLIIRLATRFHESVLALRKHPYGRASFKIDDEWDCQYLFRSILAAYFRDVRSEERNPSVAGSSSRCEFFVKQLRLMIELKFVRRPENQKRIKSELLTDFADYGANPEVDFIIALVYDPEHHLPAAVQLQDDLSGPRNGLKDIRVICSPRR